MGNVLNNVDAGVSVLKENNTEFVHMLLHNVDAVCGGERVCYAIT